jgi:uridine phosphorylase
VQKKSIKTKTKANRPIIGGLQYHIRLKKGDIPTSVLLPGDPARVAKIASFWDTRQEVAYNREYHTMKGIYKNIPIACLSTGVGSPAAAIAIEELARIGTKIFIRVGTCGCLQSNMHLGDVVISTGGVRLDGASRDYVIPEYPAVADFQIVEALIQGAKNLKIPYHVGITASTDTFYCGQGRPGYNEYLPSHKENILRDMQEAGVLNFEMEVSCILTLAAIFGVHAGAVCVVIANRVTNEFDIRDEYEERPGKVASEAIRILKESHII